MKYSPWLKAYAVFSGTFKEGWIPDNYYGKVVGPRPKSNYGDVSHCKAISSRLFQTALLPDLAYSVNRLLCTASMETVKASELKKYLFETSERVVFKLDGGVQGRNARSIGWDVVVDEHEEVAVMEWNGRHNDIKFSEAAHGPCFADLGWENLWQT